MIDEDVRNEELRKLREELDGLKEQLRRISSDMTPPKPEEPLEVHVMVPEDEEEPPVEGEPPVAEEPDVEEEEEWDEEFERDKSYRRRRRYDYDRRYDFGDRLGDYIGGFVEDIMEGVATEIEQSLFVHPRGRVVLRNRVRKPRRVDAKKAASVMSALGNEYRLKILDALSSGGLYSSELQEALKEISPSTLSSHLDVLEEAGLVTQERRRGRYLITMPGRVAVEMAYEVSKRSREEPEF
jgi:DNA-binding transcriptional ArsR family regulator